MALLGFAKPEFLLRPRNLLRRLRFRDAAALPERMEVQVLGQSFAINPHEVIGRHILHYGLFDLLVSETLWRLTGRGETALDIGANIGFMTRILAERVGPSGRVHAFEPHPEIFAELCANTPQPQVTQHHVAASDRRGTAQLHLPAFFTGNRGIGSMEQLTDSARSIEIATVTLDDLLADADAIGTVKIDVEGHELKVLMGASELLRAGRIRDIVFEEHDTTSSPLFGFLADLGYSVFRLYKGFFGPQLLTLDRRVSQSAWESPSFLATRDPIRAAERLAGSGWRVLAAV